MQEKHITFGEQVIDFFDTVDISENLPEGVSVLSPYKDAEVKKVVREFYGKYYGDSESRVFILGINPGRFGSGVTGISFTDPHALRESCGISHEFSGQREISAKFVYEFIHQFGGSEAFYRKFYLTSICPLGFVKGKKNYNYYDDKALLEATEPFIVESIRKQQGFGAKKVAIVFGTGKNQKFFKELNDKCHFFDDFVVLPHPRYIMQYKSKEKAVYLKKYQDAFQYAFMSA